MMEYWNIGFFISKLVFLSFITPLFLGIFSTLLHYSSIPIFRIPIFRHLASRVVLFMNLLQSLSSHMGIDLGGRDICMAKHHLDRTKIRPPF